MLRKHRPKPVEIGFPWALLFIPVLFVLAGLSVPYTLVANRVLKRRERGFHAQMAAAGRLMTWSGFRCALEQNRGTFIEERYSFKGPVRWWWTPENFYTECCYPSVDWLTMHHDPDFQPLAEWCRRRYTSPDQGQAFLVAIDGVAREEIHHLKSWLYSDSTDARWIELPPPKRFA
jgi:hypothetical protein